MSSVLIYIIFIYNITVLDNKNIKTIDHTNYIHKIYNQGDIGACVINAFCAIFNFNMNKYKDKNPDSVIKPFLPSRFFLYNLSCCTNMAFKNYILNINVFTIINLNNGGGTYIQWLFDTINSYGILEEFECEKDNQMTIQSIYDNPLLDKKTHLNLLNKMAEKETNITKKNIINDYITNVKNINTFDDINLSKDILDNAKLWSHNIITYKNVLNTIILSSDPNRTIQSYLNKEPIIIELNFSIAYEDKIKNDPLKTIFYSDDISEKNECLHMMVITGYKITKKKTIYGIQNSWGKCWKYNGYCYLSDDIFTNCKNKIKGLYKIKINFKQLEKKLKKTII